MNLKKLVVLTAAAGALSGLSACTEGDETNITIEGDTNTTTNTSGGTNTGNGSSTVSQNCPDFASARNRDAAGMDVCALPSTIKSSMTLTNDTVWYIDGRITVGNGNLEMSSEGVLAGTGNAVDNVTLTIEAGTEIKAKTGSNTSLLITRGSKIMAEGTAADPIIFSSDDAGYDGSSEWGGLVISGYAPHNECPTNGDMCNVDGEAEAGRIGGASPNDNSGVLKYVIITEGGFEILPGDEINGLSLAAVGAGTTIDYVQINGNSDDGVEFYGGTVNAKHLVLTGNNDDSVDWDEGFQGNLQFVIVKQADGVDGNGIEADTFGTDEFLSKPVLANATFIGGAGGSDLIHRMKKGTGGFIVNSILTGNSGQSACIEVQDDAAVANINTSLVYDNVILDCVYDNTLGFGGPLFEEAASLNANLASQSANAKLAAATDWTVFNGTYSEAGANASFLEQTDYIGAVDPDAATAWFAGWILDGTL